MKYSPHDLLPIKRPLEDTKEYPPDYFYENVVKYLIPDIVKLEYVGIPINLDKVAEVENTVNNVLDSVVNILSESNLVNNFLYDLSNEKQKDEIDKFKEKDRDASFYKTEFNIKNKAHLSYLVNYYLKSIEKEEYVQPTCTKSDLKKLRALVVSPFLDELIGNNISPQRETLVLTAMNAMAEERAALYNKNRIEKKEEQLNDKLSKIRFNPASSQQKAAFFKWLGIDSENETPAGNDKWDRAELERLLAKIDAMLEGENEA